MALADEMKNLVEEMRVGKAERRRRLGEIRKETAEDLSGFTSSRKRMSGDLRGTLRASTETVKEEVSRLRKDFRAKHKLVKEEIQAMKRVWRGAPETPKKLRKETYPKE